MMPLCISARLGSGLVCPPEGYIHLDALLAATVARIENLPWAYTAAEVLPIEIPIRREPRGRFHLSSVSLGRFARMERGRAVTKRFPVEQLQMFGDPKVKSVNLSAGLTKNYRIPLEVGTFKEPLKWYCLGDKKKIERLLFFVSHLGKKRNAGRGRVLEWAVQECRTWDGFPVLSGSGEALRPLPLDWPGLQSFMHAVSTLTYPYWMREFEQEVALPTCSLRQGVAP